MARAPNPTVRSVALTRPWRWAGTTACRRLSALTFQVGSESPNTSRQAATARAGAPSRPSGIRR